MILEIQLFGNTLFHVLNSQVRLVATVLNGAHTQYFYHRKFFRAALL